MTLIAVGGSERKSGAMKVWRRILAEAKGAESRVLIVTTASEKPAAMKKDYQRAMTNLKIKKPWIEYISSREEANAEKIAEFVARFDVIFFSGGDQKRLTGILGGTRFMNAVIERYMTGDLVVAGTSAGAAAASSLMICDSEKDEEGRSPKDIIKHDVRQAAGFAWADDVAFDTHFTPRWRLSRLYNIVAFNPHVLGIGLDEDTGVVVKKIDSRSATLEVIGSGSVTILNASDMQETNIWHAKSHEPLTCSGIVEKVLQAGERYDLKTRRTL